MVAAGVAVASRVLGSMSGVLRAAAVAAVVGRRSRMMLGRRAGVRRWLGWSFGRCETARIETMAASSGAMTGDAEGASESRVAAAGYRAVVAAGIAAAAGVLEVENIAGQESEHRELPVRAGYIATSGSCPGMVQGKVLVRSVLVGIQGNRPETEVVVRSCQIVVHFQSSSFPCRPDGSSEQH